MLLWGLVCGCLRAVLVVLRLILIHGWHLWLPLLPIIVLKVHHFRVREGAKMPLARALVKLDQVGAAPGEHEQAQSWHQNGSIRDRSSQ